MFKKLLLSALMLASLVLPISAEDFNGAQVPVEKEERVLNTNNKKCVYCSLEMLAYRAKEKRLYGLASKYEGPAFDTDIESALSDRGIKYKINPRGNTGSRAIYEFLVIPCEYEKRGAAVGLRTGPNTAHMVYLAHYDIKNKRIAVIDNCDPELEIKEMDWTDFHSRWDGLAVVIYAKKDRFPRYEAIWD